MKYPLHVKLRRKLSFGLSKFLSYFNQNKQNRQEYIDLSHETIRTIVIIRPNYRIGNLIFLTPLINELAIYFPKATIDIVVGSKSAASVLKPMPNIRNIIDIPRKLLLHPLKLFSYIKKTRKTKYDVAINISSGSTSSQIVLSLLNAKYKIGFEGNKTWANYTHLQRRNPHYKHMGLEPLDYLTFFHLPYPTNTPDLDIKLTTDEIEKGAKELDLLLQKHQINHSNKKIIAIFRGARFDKKIEDEWWEHLVEKLTQQGSIVIDILSPDIPTKLNNQTISYSNKNLRILGAFLRSCNEFICGDTGPMHLAVASQAKVIALFKFNNSDTYGTISDNNQTIDLNITSQEDVVNFLTI